MAPRLTLRELMDKRGLTALELADRTGFSARQIRRVMNGDHGGSEKFHLAMHNALGDEYRLLMPVAKKERTYRQ